MTYVGASESRVTSQCGVFDAVVDSRLDYGTGIPRGRVFDCCVQIVVADPCDRGTAVSRRKAHPPSTTDKTIQNARARYGITTGMLPVIPSWNTWKGDHSHVEFECLGWSPRVHARSQVLRCGVVIDHVVVLITWFVDVIPPSLVRESRV